ETRYIIDQKLRMAGWEVDSKEITYANGYRPEKGHNYIISEWPTDSSVYQNGYADYAQFIDTKLVGIIEAKAEHKDIPSALDGQAKEYASHIKDCDQKYVVGTYGKYKVPFIYATNGRPYIEQFKIKSGIWFQDLRKPDNAPRAIKGWNRPEDVAEMLNRDIAEKEKALETMPKDFLEDPDGLNLRPYQLNAIKAAETAIREGKRSVLLALATGTGKTRLVLGLIYRFLKSERFRRILFVVDRNALGGQAMDTFKSVRLEELMPLTDIYDVKSLDDTTFEKETKVQIATVQGLVKRLLYNGSDDPKTALAVSDYDLIIVDEAHRGYILDKEMSEAEQLYRNQADYQSKYRQVIEYFDAVKIGLTATPALQTTEIFGEPIYTYTYREAVIDGWLIDHDAPFTMETELSKKGIHFEKGEKVKVLLPDKDGQVDTARLDDELNFDVEDFNKRVITESFNRVVLERIARDIDPEEPKQGKTLIYAANDLHADLIVSILKEIYGEKGVDTDSILKITGAAFGGNQEKIK
ncbi:MAG: type I restriction-modification system endonuclease, partial [Acidaminococcaceae bacterium]|nr:type I restriction-modification system endonuclease [Acidaminococcaceae bacterium]